MRLRGHLRPFRHQNHHRRTVGKGENAVLAGVFDCHRYVSAQSEATARLAERAEIERLREPPHHRLRPRTEMGRGSDSHRANGRDCRARTRRPLALQGREKRRRHRRVAGEHPHGTRSRRRPAGDGAFQDGTLRKRGFRLHTKRRPAEISEGCHRARLRLLHSFAHRLDLRGRSHQRKGCTHPPSTAVGRHRRNRHAKQPETASGMAANRENGAGEVESPPRTQGNTAKRGTSGEGNARAQTEKQENRTFRERDGAHHQENGLQARQRLLQADCRGKTRREHRRREIHRDTRLRPQPQRTRADAQCRGIQL